MADYVVPTMCKPKFDISTGGCASDGNRQEEWAAQALDISGAPILPQKGLARSQVLH